MVMPTLVLRRLGRLADRPVILTPHGELSPGALSLKPLRKQLFIKAARLFGLFGDVMLQPTSDLENREIARAIPWLGRTVVAPNIRPLLPLPEGPPPMAIGAPLRLVFLSRVDRKKNLDFALKVLRDVRARVSFDIYGPISDAKYMKECLNLSATLPKHIDARYRGTIPNTAVVTTLAGYDLFFLPTHGENYGYSIVDALVAGTPILVSDQTPWADLDKHDAGWAFPLNDTVRFARAIDAYAALSEPEKQPFRVGARRYIEDKLAEDNAADRIRGMLQSGLAKRATGATFVDDRQGLGARRPRVLILLDTFWRGHEANGAGQSILALCRALSDEFDFLIVGRNRTEPGAEPAPNTTDWIDEGFAKVRYLPDARLWATGLATVLRTTPFDMILAGSFFDRFLVVPTLVLRRLGLLPDRPMVISPRGELSPGALQLKTRRKHAFIATARFLGLLGGIELHPTSDLEDQELAEAAPWLHRTMIAPNIRHLVPLPEGPPPAAVGAPLKLVFLSRIDRKKNLDFAIEVLKRVHTPVSFDIYGPVSDREFMRECETLMDALPDHVQARYQGTTPNNNVVATLARYELFFLPTFGENYGHAIVDSLVAGTPILISDRTPWTDLETAHAGWSLPLSDPQIFADAIQRFSAFTHAERRDLRRGARAYIEGKLAQNEAVERTRLMLRTALAAHAAPVGRRSVAPK